MKKLLARNHEIPVAVEDRNRQTDPLTLEDEDSVGVRKRVEAKPDTAQEEILKNRIKTLEGELALSQKATSEAEIKTGGM